MTGHYFLKIVGSRMKVYYTVSSCLSLHEMMICLIMVFKQVEGPRTAEELMSTLQRVVEEQGSVLVASRVEEEERQLNRRLREEQDAAYQAALQADQV